MQKELKDTIYFNRDDDKPWMLGEIKKMDDPQKGMSNFRAVLERINRQEYYDEWANSGFSLLYEKMIFL